MGITDEFVEGQRSVTSRLPQVWFFTKKIEDDYETQ